METPILIRALAKNLEGEILVLARHKAVSAVQMKGQRDEYEVVAALPRMQGSIKDSASPHHLIENSGGQGPTREARSSNARSRVSTHSSSSFQVPLRAV